MQIVKHCELNMKKVDCPKYELNMNKCRYSNSVKKFQIVKQHVFNLKKKCRLSNIVCSTCKVVPMALVGVTEILSRSYWLSSNFIYHTQQGGSSLFALNNENKVWSLDWVKASSYLKGLHFLEYSSLLYHGSERLCVISSEDQACFSSSIQLQLWLI